MGCSGAVQMVDSILNGGLTLREKVKFARDLLQRFRLLTNELVDLGSVDDDAVHLRCLWQSVSSHAPCMCVCVCMYVCMCVCM